MTAYSTFHTDFSVHAPPAQATDAAPVSFYGEVDLAGADVVELAELLNIDIALAPFGMNELQLALEIERELAEDGAYPVTDLLDNAANQLVELGMTAIAHLQAQPDYYTLLTRAQAPGDPPVPTQAHHGIGFD